MFHSIFVLHLNVFFKRLKKKTTTHNVKLLNVERQMLAKGLSGAPPTVRHSALKKGL